MNGDASLNVELQRINTSLTQALCHQQNLTSKLNRQLFYAKEDLQKSQQHVTALENMLLQQQQQQDEQRQLQQHSVLNPSALFGCMAPPPAHLPPPITNETESFMEHRTAGTLLSPSKKGRRPLSNLSDNAPLKFTDLPSRYQSKRVPLNSPPTKQAPKRQSNRPTPQKIVQSRIQLAQGTNSSGSSLAKDDKKQSTMSLSELRASNWTEAEERPNYASCRPLLTAIFRLTDGNVSILKASLDWLVENVPLCHTIKQMVDPGALSVAANIEAWLEHNFNDHRKKGGTLPLDMEQALQAICSAALFNPSKPMNILEVQRVLPSIGGRKRLTRMKELNAKMIAENKKFSLLDRKQRKDAMWPLLCLFVRRKICWSDKYTKVDTNHSRKIKCKEPQIEAMDGGGFQLIGWKIVEREMRMWYEETKLSDVLHLVVNSPEWKQLKTEHPSVSIGRNSLRLALCPSVRKPSFRSCVNEKMSALSYLMEDFYSIVNNNEVLRKRIDECQCRRHRTARDMKAMGCPPPSLWHEELRYLPSRFCGMATCAKEDQPNLQVGEKEPPKLRAMACTKSSCPSCGFIKKMGLGDPECTAFSGCSELMEVTLWEKAARNGDRFQREPTRYTGADRKSVAEVYSILADEVAPTALEHLGEAQWWHAQVDRKVATFKKNELLIYTDFSATPELIAKEVGNCHEAEHCVIDVLVVLDDPRTVKVVGKDGEVTEKRINDCTYWAFLGPTDGKGKKNDHRFHREALHSVISYHKNKALARSVTIDIASLLTDNCSGQYKSQYNMGDVAWFAETHSGIRLEHCYAPVFEFKGVHDGFGKTVKWKFKEAELKGTQIANATAGYAYLLQHYAGRRSEWDALEQDASSKLLQRGSFTMTEVRVGFIADTKEEVDSVRETHGGNNIHYCDRSSVPRTVGDKAAEGLTEIYSVRGKRQSITGSDGSKWELELSTRVCFCSVCSARDSDNQKCPYYELRNVRQITVVDMSNDNNWCIDQQAKRAVALHFRKRRETGYVNMERMREELIRLQKPFPPNARRRELALIFLSMHETATTDTDGQDLLLAVEDDIQNPTHPSLDDDFVDIGIEQDLPLSEEEAPTDVDQLSINDIDEEDTGRDYNISDEELKIMPSFATFSDPLLQFLLSQRRLPATGSRAEQEDRLAKAVKPF